VVTEVQAGAAVTAIAFAPTGAAIALGDAAGSVLIVPLGGGRRAAVQLDAAVAALEFAPDGSRLAVGDASSTITLVAAASGESEGRVQHWSQPIRWLEWSPDGSAMLVATDAWLHALSASSSALVPTRSKLVTWPAAGAVATAISASTVGFAGIATDRSLVSGVLDLAAIEQPTNAATLVARDWPAALALRLNDNGEPVPNDR
jgi:hypothetical protein